MPDAATRLAGPTQLNATATTIYTVPGATTATVLHILVTNTSASTPSAFTLSIGADAAATRLVHRYPVPSADLGTPFVELKGFIVLAAAEILQAFADDASTLTITVNGVQTT